VLLLFLKEQHSKCTNVHYNVSITECNALTTGICPGGLSSAFSSLSYAEYKRD
jgi:hypothetical protein